MLRCSICVPVSSPVSCLVSVSVHQVVLPQSVSVAQGEEIDFLLGVHGGPRSLPFPLSPSPQASRMGGNSPLPSPTQAPVSSPFPWLPNWAWEGVLGLSKIPSCSRFVVLRFLRFPNAIRSSSLITVIPLLSVLFCILSSFSISAWSGTCCREGSGSGVCGVYPPPRSVALSHRAGKEGPFFNVYACLRLCGQIGCW